MKKFLFLLITILACTHTNSQEVQENALSSAPYSTTLVGDDVVVKDSIVYTPPKTRKNWFISLYGGMADLMSEESRYVDFFDRIKPTVGLSIGKWINPSLAVRLNVTGSKLQGYTRWQDNTNLGEGSWYFGKNHPVNADWDLTQTYVPADVSGDLGAEIKRRYFGDKLDVNGYEGYKYEVTYLAGSIDGVIDINNLFHYNPKRLLDIYLYAGMGFAHTFADSNRDQTNLTNIMGKGGLAFNFRLSDHFSVSLDGQALVVPENFDRRVGDGETMDVVANYTVGLTYTFGKPDNSRPIVFRPQVIEKIVTVVKEVPVPVTPPPAAPAKDKDQLYIVIHYNIDEYNVRESEMAKLDSVANYMRKYPNNIVSVAGYADVQTAYPAYNQRLSERRAHEIVRLLTEKYGIDKSRVMLNAYGDRVQPFKENDLNRAVIVFDINIKPKNN